MMFLEHLFVISPPKFVGVLLDEVDKNLFDISL